MWNLLLPVGSAVLNARAAERRNANQQAQNMAESEKTRYSAWSGLGGGQINNNYSDPMTAGLSGAIQGVGMNQSLKQAGFFGDSPQPENVSSMNMQDQQRQDIYDQLNNMGQPKKSFWSSFTA